MSSYGISITASSHFQPQQSHCYCPVIKCHHSSARHTTSRHVMPHPANLKALPRSFSNHDSGVVILSAAIELCEAHSSQQQIACETKRYIPVLLHCRSTPRSVSRLGGPCHCDAIMIVKTCICLSVHYLPLGLEAWVKSCMDSCWKSFPEPALVRRLP